MNVFEIFAEVLVAGFVIAVVVAVSVVVHIAVVVIVGGRSGAVPDEFRIAQVHGWGDGELGAALVDSDGADVLSHGSVSFHVEFRFEANLGRGLDILEQPIRCFTVLEEPGTSLSRSEPGHVERLVFVCDGWVRERNSRPIELEIAVALHVSRTPSCRGLEVDVAKRFALPGKFCESAIEAVPNEDVLIGQDLHGSLRSAEDAFGVHVGSHELRGHLFKVHFDHVALGVIFDLVEPIRAIVEHGDVLVSFVPMRIVLAQEECRITTRKVLEAVSFSTKSPQNLLRLAINVHHAPPVACRHQVIAIRILLHHINMEEVPRVVPRGLVRVHVGIEEWEMIGCSPFEDDFAGFDIEFLEEGFPDPAVCGPTDFSKIMGHDFVASVDGVVVRGDGKGVQVGADAFCADNFDLPVVFIEL